MISDVCHDSAESIYEYLDGPIYKNKDGSEDPKLTAMIRGLLVELTTVRIYLDTAPSVEPTGHNPRLARSRNLAATEVGARLQPLYERPLLTTAGNRRSKPR